MENQSKELKSRIEKQNIEIKTQNKEFISEVEELEFILNIY